MALSDVGIPGKEFLREALTNCSDPLKAIEEFQTENGILLPSLRPMLPLLDLHGVKRLDFHHSVREELKDKLLERINELGEKAADGSTEAEQKLKELAQKSFPTIKLGSLESIVMSILKHMDHVDDKYLKMIVGDHELYQKCDVSVKRQIWQEHQSLFGDEVSPLLSQYIKDKESAMFSQTDIRKLYFDMTPKLRRQNGIIQKLVQMVGKNVLLYDTILQFLRTLYQRTKNVHYCTLRVELLMALHDAEISDITGMDPCHKFAWCLDACIREKNIDTKRSRELQSFLEGVRKGQEQVLGDLSMTLADPYAINFLSVSVTKIMNHLICNEALPRENQVLQLMLRMLNLGLHSWDILNSQVFREPHLDPQIIIKFIPILMSLIVDDQVRLVSSKLPKDDRQSALTIIEHSGPPPDEYQSFIQNDRLASVLAIYYTFQVSRQKDRQGVQRVLGTLAMSHDNRALDDPFMHTLVSYFVAMGDEFVSEEFCTVVFDEFLLTNLGNGNVYQHLLKLVYHIYSHLPVSRAQLLLKTLLSRQSVLSAHGQWGVKLLKEMEEKIGSHIEAKEATSVKEDDFALTVPTPAPV